MNELTEILEAATGSVEEEYFRLSIDGGESVFRERVYSDTTCVCIAAQACDPQLVIQSVEDRFQFHYDTPQGL